MRAALSDQGPSAIILKTPRELVTAIFLRWLLSLSLISTSSVSTVSSSENAGCSKGPSTVGSDENLPKNIFAVATESESVSPVSSLVKNNSNCAEKQQEQYQLYRYQTGPSMDPQSIAALRRRKQNREKFRRLEKRITLRSKLDIAKMLEAAGKYVKFLEAQVHLLKSMLNGLGSARTLNPPTKKISLPMALE
jgi:hypothetical protein